MSSVGKVNGPFSMEESSAGLLNKYAPSVGELHYPSRLPNKKVKPMLFLQFGDLLTERRLADSQYLGSPCEVQFFSQDHDGLQVTNIDVGEHVPNPKATFDDHQSLCSRSGVYNPEWLCLKNPVSFSKFLAKANKTIFASRESRSGQGL